MITREFFFSLDNPVIFSVVIFILLAVMIYLFYANIYKPLQQKHRWEKENLELKNTRLMAMFAELDPSPVFRFDNEGKIILTNNSGTIILKKLDKKDVFLKDIFVPAGEIDCRDFIEKGRIKHSTVNIGESFFDITIKGIPETGFGQVYCDDITLRKKYEEELESSRQKLRQLSKHIQSVQEEEKQKISRELHDNFGQILTSIKLNIDMLEEKTADPNLNFDYRKVHQQLDEARKEIRELSYRLRPRVLDDFGLIPALKSLTEEVSDTSGIKGLFQSFNFEERLNPETESNIYRIIQEALNNISKHSGASEFNVQLIKRDNLIVVSVEDNGTGFQVQKGISSDLKSGLGMTNMSERALAINGSFFINSEPGCGTEIIIEIPLNNTYEKN